MQQSEGMKSVHPSLSAGITMYQTGTIEEAVFWQIIYYTMLKEKRIAYLQN